MRFRSLSPVCLLLAFGVLPLAAQHAGKDHAPRGFQLEESQKQKMEAIRSQHKAALEQARQAVQEARKAFHTAMRDPQANPDSLKVAHKALADTQFQLMVAQKAQRSAVRELLTPEQRERAALRQGRREGLRMGHRMEGAPRGPRMMMRGLDLDPQQRESLKTLRQSQREEGRALHEKLRAARKAFHEAARNPGSTVQDLKPLHDALAAVQFDQAMQHRQHMEAMKKVLTPEQVQKLEKDRGHRGESRGPRGMRPRR